MPPACAGSRDRRRPDRRRTRRARSGRRPGSRRRAIRSASSFGRKRALSERSTRERQAFDGREHQLHARARESWRARAARRARAAPASSRRARTRPQRAPAMLDVAVHPAHHVALQRREQRLAVALERERPRLVQPVDDGLAERRGRTRGARATATRPRAPAARSGNPPSRAWAWSARTRARSSSEAFSRRLSRTERARAIERSHSRGCCSAAWDT